MSEAENIFYLSKAEVRLKSSLQEMAGRVIPLKVIKESILLKIGWYRGYIKTRPFAAVF